MKSDRGGSWLALILCAAASSPPAQAASEAKLTGIVRLPDRKLALLELGEPSPSGQMVVRKPILGEGERDGSFSVTTIDEKSARVTLRVGPDQMMEIDLKQAPGEELANRTLQFQSAKLDQVLELYQALTKRTVLRSSSLVGIALDLKSGPGMSDTDAAVLVAEGLAEKGLVLQPRGDRFVFVIRAGQEQRLVGIPDPPDPPSAAVPAQESLASGMITFTGAELSQVLPIYADLAGRTILQPQSFQGEKINVRSQTSLTRKEALWMLDALLSLAGIAMVPEGEKFVFAVPNSRARDLPKFDPQAAAAKARKPMPTGMFKFQDADVAGLLKIYAALLGREPSGRPVPSARFTLRAQSELSQAESIFALEAVAALNNLRLELVGDDQVQIVPAAVTRSLRTQ